MFDKFGLVMLRFPVNSYLSMRNLLTALFAALVVFVVGLPMGAQAARVNTLIKGSGSTIYWAANDGKKYTFPNIATYYTWFTWDDLKTVKKIGDKELKATPTGGNVTYRGGAKLAKFPTESTVYAVSRYGILRPIVNAEVAAQLYGYNWTSKVETLPWNVRGDYRIGSMIRAAYEYSTSNEYNGVKTPTDNLEVGYVPVNPGTSYTPNLPAPTFTGTVGLALTNRLYTPDRAQFTATVSNSNRNANEITIQIKNETRNEIIQTCYASYTCSATWYVDTVATQEIVAIAKDAAGYSLGSNRVSVQGLNNSSYYSDYGYPYTYNNSNYPQYGYGSTLPYYTTIGTVSLSLSNTSVYKDEQATAYAEVKSYNVRAERLTIELYVDGTRIGTCQGTTTCSLTFNNPNVGTRQVYARVSDGYNTATQSAPLSLYVSERVNAWTQGSFWADRRLDAEWTSDRTLRLTGRITNSNRELHNLRMTIMDRDTNQNVKHCIGTDYCTIDLRTDSNWVNTNRYALLAFDMNGQELGYVYPASIGTNPYTDNYYGYPTVVTEGSIVSHDRTTTIVNLTGRVNGSINLNNTRLEIYTDAYSDLGGTYFQQSIPTRLVNTCYNTSTCSIQDRTNTTYYHVSYYTVFVDANGQRTTSPAYKIN